MLSRLFSVVMFMSNAVPLVSISGINLRKIKKSQDVTLDSTLEYSYYQQNYDRLFDIYENYATLSPRMAKKKTANRAI